MNGTSWLAGMGWVKRLGVALAVLALWAPSGRAAETIVVTIVIVVTIPVEDGEVVSSDPKRLRLAEPAVVRFAVTTPYFAQVFRDLTTARDRLRLEVLASARRVLGELPATEALKPEAARAVVADLERAIDYLGVSVESYTLRYMLVPSLVPEGSPAR
jgi:regulator of protease activity HflC (stomatin/prohibitin superfamily)